VPTNPIPRRGRGAPLAAIGLLLSSTLAFAPAVAAAGLTLNTPFPSVAVAPGSNVGFDIAVTATANQQVALAVSGVPTDWTATLRGGGYVVNGVQADADGKAIVHLDLQVPATATDGTSTVTVTATAGGTGAVLPLTVEVSAAAAGDVTLSSDFPSLRTKRN